MNAVPGPPSHQIDWIINYVEVNSKPSSTGDFRRLRISKSEIQIDPAGIVLSIQRSTEQGFELQCGSDTYFGTIVQRGNEIVVNLQRPNSSDSVVIVAKKSVSEFDPSVSFGRVSHLEMPGSAAQAMNNEPQSFF